MATASSSTMNQTPGAVLIFIHSPTSKISAERLLPTSEPISSLRARLEPITGIPPSSQLLSLHSSRTDDPDQRPPPSLFARISGALTPEEEERLTLGSLGARDGMGLKVEDERPEDVARMFSDESLVENRFELTEEEYKARNDTVLAYKQRNKLGRFDLETAAQQKASKEAEALSLETQLRQAQERFSAGQRCQVEGEAQRRGTVRFVGTAKFAKGVWVGIEYDEPVGKGDGSVNGTRYFTCAPKHGGFVKPEKVQIGDFPPIDIMDELEDDEDEEI